MAPRGGGEPPGEVFRYIRIYGALPYVFSALKISVTMCVLGAIVGEWIGPIKALATS